MKLITHQLPDDHNIFIFGDQHKGAILSSQSGWEQLVDMMHSKYDGCKNNYGIDGGDAIEAIMVDDPRFSPEQLKKMADEEGDDNFRLSPLAQMEAAIKDREPIKKQILAMLLGNHERKLWKIDDFTAIMAKRLGVHYGTYSCKISILDKKGNLMHKIFETHGNRSITSTADDPKRREANKRLILKRQLKFKAGDCAVMIKHHVHKLITCAPEPELYLTDDGKRIKQHYTGYGQNENYIHPDVRWYGCAGSFLRLYGDGFSSYAELADYDPNEIGFLVLVVRDRKIVELKIHYLDI